MNFECNLNATSLTVQPRLQWKLFNCLHVGKFGNIKLKNWTDCIERLLFLFFLHILSSLDQKLFRLTP